MKTSYALGGIGLGLVAYSFWPRAVPAIACPPNVTPNDPGTCGAIARQRRNEQLALLGGAAFVGAALLAH